MQNFELKTSRLILSRPTKNDLDDFVLHMNSCEDFSKNLFNIPFPYTRQDAENWFQKCDDGIESGESYRFAIREKEIGKLIGVIGLHLTKEHRKAELGYWLGKDFWGKGYLTEALKAVFEFGFNDLQLNKIYATHFIHNPASGRVMQKAGMEFEGLLKQEYFHQGKFLDVNRYAILKKDFESIS
ncbi:GNAT family N-acetyltransferase [Chryseobacterium sp.]|uniref:GNAT family N-acetyltransferase n=1 Tax=Chryseobacterium sp. TaxID=1871047 RepID=UPI0011C80CAA|nr:GNAT family N-acetyltransferase [Chryseobacterium sp.]TXF77410.1 GNAT family N-acetyltransferase [Chryseobacterium sp.]